MSDMTQTDVAGPALDETQIYLQFDYDDADGRFDAREWASIRADDAVDMSDHDDVSKTISALYTGETDHLDMDSWEAMEKYDGPGHYEIEVSYRT